MKSEHADLIARAEHAIEEVRTTEGYGNLVTAVVNAIGDLREADLWLAQFEADPAKNRFVTGKQIAMMKAVGKIEDKLQAIADRKAMTARKEEEQSAKAERPTTAVNSALLERAASLIEVIANSPVDVVPGDLLAMAVPEIADRYVRSRGVWYQRRGGAIEAMVEDEIAEEVAAALQAQQFGRVVGTALDLSRGDETPITVAPVLRTWAGHMKTYTSLYEHLPSDESLSVCDDLFPMVIDGQATVLHRKTGKLTADPPDGCNVLYPAIVANSVGESRALDAMVAHHFHTEEEVEAFYLTCGLSLFAYGVPNLVFLLGHGGSGKDALFSLMRAAVGERLVCTLNALALMGHDEANDLVRLTSARLALCSFESSHHSDGSFKPAVLKSITSGGVNPITARAKYARAAVDIYYRGSLWLYGNRVPNLTGGGDFDGLDRRFMILPMTKKLPDVLPPTGFNTWPEATIACAPVFTYRCLERFIKWHEAGTPGYSDVRKRIPDEWRALSNEHLMAGSRFGFLRDLFMPSEVGLQETTVFEVMGAIMKQEGIRMGRSRFHDILKDTISDSARFEGLRHLEAEDRGGVRYLPVTVVPSTLHKLLDSFNVTDALHSLRKDGSWDPDVVEVAHRFNREAQLRAKLYGEG